jgi:hypothetical protein
MFRHCAQEDYSTSRQQVGHHASSFYNRMEILCACFRLGFDLSLRCALQPWRRSRPLYVHRFVINLNNFYRSTNVCEKIGDRPMLFEALFYLMTTDLTDMTHCLLEKNFTHLTSVKYSLVVMWNSQDSKDFEKMWSLNERKVAFECRR